MKTLAVCGLVFFASGAFAQRAINHSIGTNSGFGNVLFPAGKPTLGTPFTPIMPPNFANVTGNIIAGRPAFQGTNAQGRFFGRGSSVIYVPYAYPVFGGFGYGGYGYGYGEAPPPQPSNVTVVYPPQQQSPVIVMGTPNSGQSAEPPRAAMQEYVPPPQPASSADFTSAPPDSNYYLLAFKDHSIYSAVGYWVDGDTLHYITGGNVHNQVSLSLIDRDLTAQLNKGRGVQVNLPPSK